jgi:uncharacterized protein YcbK (DUF882 family)
MGEMTNIRTKENGFSGNGIIERRDVLKMGGVAFLASVIPLFSIRKAFAAPNFGSWKVAFRHAHTGETFSGVYRVGDRYLPDVFENLNYKLRDFRTGTIYPMDPHVLDIISLIQAKTQSEHPLEIIGGYRSPKTNHMLHEISTGVAQNSLHMRGQAIDLRLPGYSTEGLRRIATGMKAGGVGYYPKSDFVHVDTGRVRYW